MTVNKLDPDIEVAKTELQFETNRILEIIDVVKYKSHVVDESMFKQLFMYLKWLNKEVVTTNDFYDAFKKENIQEETNKELFALQQMMQGSFEEMASNHITVFIRALQWLRAKWWDAFIWLQKTEEIDTNRMLLNWLNTKNVIYKSMDEMLVAIKESVTKFNRELVGKSNKTRRKAEKIAIWERIRCSIENNDFSTEDFIRCISTLNTIAGGRSHIRNAVKDGYKSKWYDEITCARYSESMTIVKRDGKCSLFNTQTLEPIVSDAEGCSYHKAWDRELDMQWGEVALKIWGERTIFKNCKKVA